MTTPADLSAHLPSDNALNQYLQVRANPEKLSAQTDLPMHNSYQDTSSTSNPAPRYRADIASAVYLSLYQLMDSQMFALNQQFFDFGNSFGRIEAFWTGISAIHNRVATIQLEGLIQFIQSLFIIIIPTISQPAVSLQ